MSILWESQETLESLEIYVPAWIDQEITPYDIAAIIQGGCESGAYMPAVTYHTALETMTEHGDDIVDFVMNHYGELPDSTGVESWSGLAVQVLSCAVEVWAAMVEDEIERALEEMAEEEA